MPSVPESSDYSASPAHVGVLLTNVGTPAAPTPRAVRTYLAQFLADPRIIDWPRWLWLPVLHGIVLNMRPRRSARLYRKVWTEHGSPLLVTLRRQAELLQASLADRGHGSVRVAVGMRYGRPSIADGLRELRAGGARRLLVFPLFPQYSATTTASTFDAVFEELSGWRWLPELRTVGDYHAHPAYLASLAHTVRERWQQIGQPDRLLLSFHGIPASYARAGDPYAERCHTTARLLAARLGLDEGAWQAAFQSRFGPTEWLRPYTDETLVQWAREGIRTVHVICPGFSADCLETIEEIGDEARHTFLAAGGAEFDYVPALNDRADHIAALTTIALSHLQGWVDEGPGK